MKPGIGDDDDSALISVEIWDKNNVLANAQRVRTMQATHQSRITCHPCCCDTDELGAYLDDVSLDEVSKVALMMRVRSLQLFI